MIPDGDVAGAVMAATPGTGVDVLLGIGGAPEAVVAACAIKCLGGEIQCVRYPRNEAERKIAVDQDISLTEVLGIERSCGSCENVFFSATGITDGELVRGVQFLPERRLDILDRHALPDRHDPPHRRDPSARQIPLAERPAV